MQRSELARASFPITPRAAGTGPTLVVRKPQWPGSVPGPDAPGFESSAKAWLFGLCPPRWQLEQLFHRRPDELARMVRQHLEAELATAQAALRRIRGPRMPLDHQELLDIYQRERDWAAAMRDQVWEVEAALQECRRKPRRAS